jgi:transcriptional regulator GlxA family with amidase domain
MRVAIMLFDGVEELDWAGPWEVLTMWSALERRARRRSIDVTSVADSSELVTCAKGIRVVPDTTWPALADAEERPDLLVVPGGRGTRALINDAPTLARLRELHAGGTQVASVCTGALLLASAGLLAGRPATTHHGALDELRGLDSSCEVRADVRWVDDGDVLTAAGVSAGIDLALHLVDRHAGTEMARAVRAAIQYDPMPPV